MKIEINDELVVQLSDAVASSHESGEVDDLKRIRDIVDTLLLYIPDPRGAQTPRPVVEPPVERIVTKPRGKLTPHQREVYGRIERLSRGGTRWVAGENIGSLGACNHLYAKGWITVDIQYGPRGGERPMYRPTMVTP
jgi:hypothetical protein